MRFLTYQAMLAAAICAFAAVSAVAQDGAPFGKFYRTIDGKVDARTYNGFRRFHAGCNYCHGMDAMGSTFGPTLIDMLPDIETFRRVVRDGKSDGTSVMQGFAGDPNVAPYIRESLCPQPEGVLRPQRQRLLTTQNYDVPLTVPV